MFVSTIPAVPFCSYKDTSPIVLRPHSVTSLSLITSLMSAEGGKQVHNNNTLWFAENIMNTVRLYILETRL